MPTTVEVDQDMDPESQEYMEALEQVTSELEYCVNLCKSRIMMVTCFDIRVASEIQEGPREVEVWELYGKEVEINGELKKWERILEV